MTNRDEQRDPRLGEETHGDTVGTNQVNRDDPYDYDRPYYRPPAGDDGRYGYASDRGHYGPNVNRGVETPQYVPLGDDDPNRVDTTGTDAEPVE